MLFVGILSRRRWRRERCGAGIVGVGIGNVSLSLNWNWRTWWACGVCGFEGGVCGLRWCCMSGVCESVCF